MNKSVAQRLADTVYMEKTEFYRLLPVGARRPFLGIKNDLQDDIQRQIAKVWTPVADTLIQMGLHEPGWAGPR